MVWLNGFIFCKVSFPLGPCEKSLFGTTGLIGCGIKILLKKRVIGLMLACLTPLLKDEGGDKSVLSVTDCTVCDADNAVLCTN